MLFSGSIMTVRRLLHRMAFQRAKAFNTMRAAEAFSTNNLKVSSGDGSGGDR